MDKDILERIDDAFAEIDSKLYKEITVEEFFDAELNEGIISRTLGTLRMQLGNAIFSRINYGAINNRINKMTDPNDQRRARLALQNLQQQAKDVMISLQQLMLAVEDI